MIRLGALKVNEKSKQRVLELLEKNILGQSEVIEEFEKLFAAKLGVNYAVAVSSGTMADTIALAVIKHLRPDRNEVIVPAQTFAAQLNSVLYNGLKPVFYDYHDQISTLITNKTLCIFPVHLLGRPTDLVSDRQIMTSCRIYGIEDACQAMGTKYSLAGLASLYAGTVLDMGTFSFFPSHTISTGEGGMIVSNNEEMYELCRKFRNHGRASKDEFHFDVVGFNGKMSSIQAAIGIGMLDDFDKIVKKRTDNLKKYGYTGELYCPHGWEVQYDTKEERDARLVILRKNGIECRNMFSCLPTQEKAYQFLGHHLGEFPHSEARGDRGLYVPCHQELTGEDIQKIKSLI